MQVQKESGRIGHHPQEHWIDASLGEGMPSQVRPFVRKTLHDRIYPPYGDVEDQHGEPTRTVAQAFWKWCKNHGRGGWTKTVRDGDLSLNDPQGNPKGRR